MIIVKQVSELKPFQKELNEINSCKFQALISTHVGVDKSGWWGVVIYEDFTLKPYRA